MGFAECSKTDIMVTTSKAVFAFGEASIGTYHTIPVIKSLTIFSINPCARSFDFVLIKMPHQ